MKRRSIYVFVSATLAMIVPAPGRFVYGLVLLLELYLLLFSGTLANSISRKFDLKELRSTVIFTSVIMTTILYRELLIFINPEIVITLGFNMYLIPVSFFVIGYLFTDNESSFGKRFVFNYSQAFIFSIYALVIFIIRDIFGYGTITYFGFGFKIKELILFSEESVSFLSMLASIPGVLFLSSVILFIYVLGRGRVNIIKNIASIQNPQNTNSDNNEETENTVNNENNSEAE